MVRKNLLAGAAKLFPPRAQIFKTLNEHELVARETYTEEGRWY